VHVVSVVMPVDVCMLEDMPCKRDAKEVHVIAQTEYQSKFGVIFFSVQSMHMMFSCF
jgi:hypothetical protein